VTAGEALAELLAENPHRLVTYRMVCERLGRTVSRNAVSMAAYRLGRRRCIGVPGAKGGYRSGVWR